MADIRQFPTDPRGKHRAALERTLKGRDVTPALAELARDLADQCDAASSGPSTRLSATYLSALKDIARSDSGAGAGKGGKLAELRAVTMAKLSPIPDNAS
ncbi:hypothetical protein ACIG56_30015 [Nocardia fusca]|uniref:hypothetical protein n=1 Tax=Nocardia fusca TaxID=941183 RepID=UPI0037CBE7AD